jgi:hypothetical protein
MKRLEQRGIVDEGGKGRVDERLKEVRGGM